MRDATSGVRLYRPMEVECVGARPVTVEGGRPGLPVGVGEVQPYQAGDVPAAVQVAGSDDDGAVSATV